MKLFNISLILAVVVAVTAVGCGTNNPAYPYNTTTSGLGRTPCINGAGGAYGAYGASPYGASPYGAQYGAGCQQGYWYNQYTGQMVPGSSCTPPYGAGVAGGIPGGAIPGAVPGMPGVAGSCACNAGFYPNLSSTACVQTSQCPSTNNMNGIIVCNIQ